jgi:hypothetical protein
MKKWAGDRMATEGRYCRECRTVTQHVVVGGKDIMAYLCHQCLGRWATQLDVTEQPVSGPLARPGRRIENANAEPRTKTQDKDRPL